MSSNIFLSSNIDSVVNATENTEMPSWLTVAVTEQRGGNDNATSDLFLSQIEGDKINQLINMVTSVDQQGGALEETSTEELEQELRDIISGQYAARRRSKRSSKKSSKRRSRKMKGGAVDPEMIGA